MLLQIVGRGMGVNDDAALVVDAVRDGTFAVLTHADWAESVRRRTDALLEGRLAEFRLPGTLTD